jgi:hypothetical protein
MHPSGPGPASRTSGRPHSPSPEDQTTILRNRNKLRWRDWPARWVAPADQRHRPGNLSGPQIDLRLIALFHTGRSWLKIWKPVINTLRPLKVAGRLWSKVHAITDSGLPSLGTVRGAWLADILRLRSRIRSMDQRESTMWRPCRSRGSYFSVGFHPTRTFAAMTLLPRHCPSPN